MKTIRLIVHAFRDLYIQLVPMTDKARAMYGYAFLVHPRNSHDVSRKYPAFKYLPKWATKLYTRFLWPVVLSEIEGLTSQSDSKPVRGWVITIPLTATQMIENRDLALKRITRAAILAQKMGAKIIGLGALTSSFSKGGLDLIDKVEVGITTGHAYTAYVVTQNVFKVSEILGIDRAKLTIAIVGATGSVGSTCAKVLARGGFGKIILIDVSRKKHFFDDLVSEIKSLNSRVIVETAQQIGRIKEADFIVTATNAPEAVIRADDLKSGAVVFDDAQPSDVAPDVLERTDVIALEAGLVYTPNIKNHFNFGLKGKYDNFCCLGEVLILASRNWKEHYIINRASLKHVDEIAEHGKQLGFELADFQNFREPISKEKLDGVLTIARANYNVESQ